ncbi:hypothetical protein M405DRAFT_881552 [Rhizopogon salebrosus TDB-379]|nr:hypothetical protein M405DRAFT_881552 [Rhizopogon salebrosus TDB-379]
MSYQLLAWQLPLTSACYRVLSSVLPQFLLAGPTLPDYSLKWEFHDTSSHDSSYSAKAQKVGATFSDMPHLLVTAPSVICNHPSLPLKPSLATDKAETSPITGLVGQPSKSLKKQKRDKSTGWQGTNYNATKEGKMLKEEWLDYSILRHLTEFTKVYYENMNTFDKITHYQKSPKSHLPS